MLYSAVLVSHLFWQVFKTLSPILYIDVESKLLGYQDQQRPMLPHTCPCVTQRPTLQGKGLASAYHSDFGFLFVYGP